MSMIKIEHLRKEYPNITPLKDVNAEIYKGDVISVIGPSGTGKSTMLRCIDQLEMPTSGTVTFEDGTTCNINTLNAASQFSNTMATSRSSTVSRGTSSISAARPTSSSLGRKVCPSPTA